jgi:hypothetical protein
MGAAALPRLSQSGFVELIAAVRPPDQEERSGSRAAHAARTDSGSIYRYGHHEHCSLLVDTPTCHGSRAIGVVGFDKAPVIRG